MSDIVKVDSSLAAMQLMLVAKQYGYDTNLSVVLSMTKLAKHSDMI